MLEIFHANTHGHSLLFIGCLEFSEENRLAATCDKHPGDFGCCHCGHNNVPLQTVFHSVSSEVWSLEHKPLEVLRGQKQKQPTTSFRGQTNMRNILFIYLGPQRSLRDLSSPTSWTLGHVKLKMPNSNHWTTWGCSNSTSQMEVEKYYILLLFKWSIVGVQYYKSQLCGIVIHAF